MRSNTPDYETIVATPLHNDATPGACVALLIDGQPVYEAGVGSSDLEGHAPLEATAQFYVYSTTKTLLAIATLRLVEQGRLQLDTPIQTYLPTLPLTTPVSVRQILNHTGGIPDYAWLPEYHDDLQADPSHPWSPTEFLERTLPHGLSFAPGQSLSYSNIGYLIVKLLLEDICEMTLGEILHETIIAPLGLAHTFVAETLHDAATLTPGYSASLNMDDTLSDIAPFYHPGWVSHGVVVSTALELATIYDALFAGRLLSADSLATMLHPVPVPHPHPLFDHPAYGLGLMIDASAAPDVIAGHGGGGPGYSIGAVYFSNINGQRVTSVALANRDQPDLGLRIAFALARAVTQRQSAS